MTTHSAPPPSAPLKLVLDTNVVLDLLVFDDIAIQPLKILLVQQGAELYASPHTLNELERVLAYPQLSISVTLAENLKARYTSLCTIDHSSTPLPALPQCRDPDDQPFIELATRICADALLSKDKAVLHLGRQRYRAQLGFCIATPQQFFRSPVFSSI